MLFWYIFYVIAQYKSFGPSLETQNPKFGDMMFSGCVGELFFVRALKAYDSSSSLMTQLILVR